MRSDLFLTKCGIQINGRCWSFPSKFENNNYETRADDQSLTKRLRQTLLKLVRQRLPREGKSRNSSYNFDDGELLPDLILLTRCGYIGEPV